MGIGNASRYVHPREDFVLENYSMPRPRAPRPARPPRQDCLPGGRPARRDGVDQGLEPRLRRPCAVARRAIPPTAPASRRRCSGAAFPPARGALALIVEDADAPTPQPSFMPSSSTSRAADGALAEGALPTRPRRCRPVRRSQLVPAGGVAAPDPPPGHGVHRYAFQLFALHRERSLRRHAGPRAVPPPHRGVRPRETGRRIGTYEWLDHSIKASVEQSGAPALSACWSRPERRCWRRRGPGRGRAFERTCWAALVLQRPGASNSSGGLSGRRILDRQQTLLCFARRRAPRSRRVRRWRRRDGRERRSASRCGRATRRPRAPMRRDRRAPRPRRR